MISITVAIIVGNIIVSAVMAMYEKPYSGDSDFDVKVVDVKEIGDIVINTGTFTYGGAPGT